MEDLGYIYKITNKINYLCYIGQTVNFDERVYNHKRAKENSILHHTIRKYGVENFIFEILERWPKETLAEREKTWIAFYNTFEGEGYNMTPGGEGYAGKDHPMYGKKHTEESKRKMSESRKGDLNHFYGKTHTEETKRKISESLKGTTHTEETKTKMSEARKGKFTGKDHPMYGKTHTEEAKRKISEASKGRIHSEEARRKMSESLKGKYTGKNSAWYGKTHAEKTKEKMSRSRKLYWDQKKSRKLKEAGQLDLFEG